MDKKKIIRKIRNQIRLSEQRTHQAVIKRMKELNKQYPNQLPPPTKQERRLAIKISKDLAKLTKNQHKQQPINKDNQRTNKTKNK